MTKFLFLFLTFALFVAQASVGQSTSFALSSRLQWAAKGTAGNNLPHALGPPISLTANFEIPTADPTLNKVFEQIFSHQNLVAKIQIWFHRKQGAQYYSQQVQISEDGQLLAFCTNYFDFTQTYLIPGACWGRSRSQENTLLGISIYKP